MAPDFSKQLPDLNQPSSGVECYEWAKESGLLRINRVCDSCGKPLAIGPSEIFPIYEALICDNDRCEKLNHEISSLHESFFDPYYLNLSQWLHVIHNWCFQITKKDVISKLDIGEYNVKKGYENCRNFCAKYVDRFPKKLSQNVIVKKYERRGRNGYICFLMMVSIGSSDSVEKNVLFMKEISLNISEADLISEIENAVEPGSLIISDEFGKSPTANLRELKLSICNNDEDKICTSYYQVYLQQIAQLLRAGQENRENILKECMWRERVEGDPYEYFIENLKTFYKS